VLRPAALTLAGVALVGLSACASSDAGGDGGSSDAGTSLTIVVTPAEGAKTSTYDLTCDPAGGEHPQPAQACDAIAAGGADIFEEPPADQTCTQQYGGPQVATITGTYDGKDVEATFSRANGCEIDRWDELGTTVFNVPLL
jgi:hypothetical protein